MGSEGKMVNKPTGEQVEFNSENHHLFPKESRTRALLERITKHCKVVGKPLSGQQIDQAQQAHSHYKVSA